MTPAVLAQVAVLAPLLVALPLLAFGTLRRAGRAAAAMSIGGATASLFASVGLLVGRIGHDPTPDLQAWVWFFEGDHAAATIGLNIDGISAPMLAIVALVATCVQVFSFAYLADEEDAAFGRYFTWQSLFLFSMQALVASPNLLQLFAAWELVGLCSYLLIGFYYQKPSAARAALKAFWVTKLADLGLVVGLIVQYSAVGSFGWDAATVSALSGLAGVSAVVAGCYFLAVMGKSAQFPLHVWLPDAMEGPTPVSALLHAATMVAAGVYLVVRAYPIFEAAPGVMTFMAVIGGFTAVFAAVLALGQSDIKRVLAYSTASQLGYMVAALGAGGLFGAYFHLGTHAFFKALLFLSAGSVIHAVHSNELSHMGGLARRMPFTALTFGVAALALCGFPGLSGFFSKDLILEALYEGTHHDPVLWFPFLACLLTVGLTATYMSRVVFLAFFGPPGEHTPHAHEGGLAMTVPLGVLFVPTVVAGLFGGTFLGLLGLPGVEFHLLHLTPVGLVAMALTLGGIGLGWALATTPAGARADAAFAPMSAILAYGAVDRLWLGGYRVGMLGFARGFAWVDRYVIDGLLNAVGAASLVGAQELRRIQTGRATDYVYAVMVGVIGLTVWSQLFSAFAGGAR